ncbi:metabotropic glutamate receptor-like [Ptychodera flava]|uniref:metabotropic glutamate receptor-like n=1 Tax=Ptychodera flava TaxID=63121 RepID=UPI003969C7E2
MESIDSCLSGDLASPLTLKFVSTGEFGSSGSGERISTETGQREYIFGVVGGADDDVCKAVVEVLQVYMIPEISYKAGVAALSNAWNYPNFLRTVPPDTIQMAALIQVMAKLGWSYIQAIHIESTYGWDCTSVLRQQAPQAGICLTQYMKVRDPSSDDQIDEVLAKLAKRPLAKGIVIIGPVDLAVAVLRGIKRNSLEGKYYLIRSDTQGQEMLPDDVLDVARGTVTVSQRQRRAEQFVSHMTSLTPQSNTRNPWFDEYWMQKFQCVLLGQDANCSDSDRLKAEDIPINTVASVMDAVGAFAHALDELHKTLCYQSDKVCDSLSDLPGEEFIQKLKGLRFQSLAGDGKTVYFNYQGDDNGEFDLYNFVQDGDEYKYIQVGTYDRVKLLEMTNNITFYTSDGEVMASPPISDCIGPCDDCKAFKKAKVGEMLGGDIWIGGLFEMRKPGETLIDCSDDLVMYNIQLLEAFYFALDQVNADNTTLPDLKLGAVAFDTCGLVERGVRETTNFVTGGVEYRSNYPPSGFV